MRYYLRPTIAICMCTGILQMPVTGQNTSIRVTYFTTAQNFNLDSAGTRTVAPVIAVESPEFIRVSRWIDTSTGQRAKKFRTPWAVRYQGANYISLGYCEEYGNFSMFVRPHVNGRFCAFTISKETDAAIKNSGPNYGSGLQGWMMKDIEKWGKNWRTEAGDKNKILVVDTHRTYSWNGTNEATWFILDRKNFNTILHTEFTADEIDSFTWEQVMQIIIHRNAAEG